MSEPPFHSVEMESRLEAISTRRSLVVGPDRQALALRYHHAIRSYLGAMLRDDHEADEVAQDVMVRLLKGDFAGAAPERGRFRDYLKVAVRNAALSFLRRKNRSAPAELDPAGMPDSGPSPEESWVAGWRRSVLAGALAALEAYQRQHPGNLFHTLVRFLVDAAAGEVDKLTSEEMAERLSQTLGRPVRAAAVRKQLSRARRKFAELLVEEVGRTLEEPTPARVTEELHDLGLMSFVREFLPAAWPTPGPDS